MVKWKLAYYQLKQLYFPKWCFLSIMIRNNCTQSKNNSMSFAWQTDKGSVCLQKVSCIYVTKTWWCGKKPNQNKTWTKQCIKDNSARIRADLPDRSIGSLSTDLRTWSDSPVKELSSILRSFPWINIPSAGRRSPFSKNMGMENHSSLVRLFL